LTYAEAAGVSFGSGTRLLFTANNPSNFAALKKEIEIPPIYRFEPATVAEGDIKAK
jgi:hypothetical protein